MHLSATYMYGYEHLLIHCEMGKRCNTVSFTQTAEHAETFILNVGKISICLLMVFSSNSRYQTSGFTVKKCYIRFVLRRWIDSQCYIRTCFVIALFSVTKSFLISLTKCQLDELWVNHTKKRPDITPQVQWNKLYFTYNNNNNEEYLKTLSWNFFGMFPFPYLI